MFIWITEFLLLQHVAHSFILRKIAPIGKNNINSLFEHSHDLPSDSMLEMFEDCSRNDSIHDSSFTSKAKISSFNLRYQISRLLPVLPLVFNIPLFTFAPRSYARSNVVSAKQPLKSGKDISKGKEATKNKEKQTDKKVIKKVVVDVSIKRDDESRKDQLNKIGIALVAGCVLKTILSGEDKTKSKSSEKDSPETMKSMTPSSIADAPKPKPPRENTIVKKVKESPKDVTRAGGARLPRVEDDPLDDLFSDNKLSQKQNIITKTEMRPSVPLIDDENILPQNAMTETGDIEKSFSTEASTKSQVSQVDASKTLNKESSTPSVSPVTTLKPKKSANIFQRLFPKQGGGRPTSLQAALSIEDLGQPFRISIAAKLLSTLTELPQKNYFADVVSSAEIERQDTVSDEDLVRRWATDSGLGQAEAAEAFADVASAILVTLVDRAAAALPATKSSPTSSAAEGNATAPSAIVVALDGVVNLASAAADLFRRVIGDGAVLSSPVVYNGDLKRGKLEDMYVAYSKASIVSSTLSIAADGNSTIDWDKNLQQVRFDRCTSCLVCQYIVCSSSCYYRRQLHTVHSHRFCAVRLCSCSHMLMCTVLCSVHSANLIMLPIFILTID